MGFELVAATLVAGATSVVSKLVSQKLKNEAASEAQRLRVLLHEGQETSSGEALENPPGQTEPVPRAGVQRVDDDKFAELLIEYYAWGLTQARRATALSLTCSGLGVAIILGGVALAIWRAETSGDVYASIVASLAGLVSTIVGALAHKRADGAMAHMQRQTESLRQDMRRERETEAAIRILGEIEDRDLRSHLQAALVLKLAGADLPALPQPPGQTEDMQLANGHVPPRDYAARNGAGAT